MSVLPYVSLDFCKFIVYYMLAMPKVNIIPYPNGVEPINGYFKIDQSVALFYCNEAAKAAKMLCADLQGVLQCTVECTQIAADGVPNAHGGQPAQNGAEPESGGQEDAQRGNCITFTADKNLGPESYRVKIEENGISAQASGATGFLYAYYTLRQYLELDKKNSAREISADCVLIEDSPVYAWRGFMLDEARHFFGLAEVKRIIELMSVLKLNKFHWHLSDDQGFRVESLRYPKLTEVSSVRSDTQIGGWKSNKFRGTGHGGYYTQNEVREIVAFAAERGIEVVPELSVPGHIAAVIAAMPELSCTGEHAAVKTKFGRHDLIACAGRESTYELLGALIEEWAQLFPAPYFHLGGNHARRGRWKECNHCVQLMEQQGFTTIKELENYMFTRLAKHVESLGKTPIIRSDALNKNSPSNSIGDYYLRLNNDDFLDYLATGRKYISSRHKAYYLDHPYALTPLKLSYNYNPAADDVQIDTAAHLLGVEAALFTEWVYDREKIDFNVFPRLAAVAESGWTKAELKNYRSFLGRLKALNRLLRRYNVNYAKMRIAGNRNLIKRFRELSRWVLSDQYSEVRQNRE